MSKLFNSKHLKQFRRNLRNEMPKAEVILWQYLRGKQLDGFKFRRQHSIGNYIVDFYCSEKQLVIELDGESHYIDEVKRAKDKKRDKYLSQLGITVIRYLNTDIYFNLSGVLETLSQHLANLPSHHPQPLLGQEG